MAEDNRTEELVAPGLGQDQKLPVMVCNGFGLQMSATEIGATLMFMNKPTTVVVMSPSVAKSLRNALAKFVAEYEKVTKTSVLGLEELTQRIKKIRSGPINGR